MAMMTKKLTRRETFLAFAGALLAEKQAEAQGKKCADGSSWNWQSAGCQKTRQARRQFAIADYYIAKRRVPKTNVVTINCPIVEEISRKDYDEKILAPVKAFLARTRLKVDFILLTKGIPIRVSEGGFAVDSLLATLDFTLVHESGDSTPISAKMNASRTPKPISISSRAWTAIPVRIVCALWTIPLPPNRHGDLFCWFPTFSTRKATASPTTAFSNAKKDSHGTGLFDYLRRSPEVSGGQKSGGLFHMGQQRTRLQARRLSKQYVCAGRTRRNCCLDQRAYLL